MADDLNSISSTTVDLSRLPAPTVVVQMSYEDIRAQLVAKMVTLTTAAGLAPFDATVESDPVVKLIEDFAYRELLLRADFNDRARQLLLAYAQESNLDHLGALFNVGRLLVTAATDTAEAVYEDDTAYRQRILLSVEALSVAGPEAAYVFHAKSARGDILDASATSPAPDEFVAALLAAFTGAGASAGQLAAVQAAINLIAWPGDVRVTVLSAVGNGAASLDQIADVEAILTSKPVRPLTDAVTVQSAGIVPFDLVAQLILYSGPDASIVTTNAQAQLAAYLDASRKLGRDIPRSALYAALTVEGVQRVILTSPPADIEVSRLQAAWCRSIDVSYAGNGD